MSIVFEVRESDSPYIESVTRGQAVSDGAPVRPAESHWHLVFLCRQGQARSVLVGPWTTAGVASYGEGAELLWVKFRLGVFMPHQPPRDFLDVETFLPGATSRRFWLKSAAWQWPDYGNVETFVERLVREEVLVRDPVVSAVLHDEPPALSPRTVRHRFLRATGLTYSHIHQVERAQRAATLLGEGQSILDTVDALGYYDQPHLTRSLKRWVGHTPAQLTPRQPPA
jgi:hypothetical protein